MKKSTFKKFGFRLLLCCFLAGCGTDSANLSILEETDSADADSLTSATKLDLLFVIDNSGSMAPKQQNLSDNFDSFVNTFVDKRFDFNIAIVTTDTRTAAAGGQDSDFQGTPTVLTDETDNFVNLFKTNVLVGALGDPSAKAMDAIATSLSAGKRATTNAGFIRDDAHLAIIILSDSDDFDSTTGQTALLTFLDGLKPATTTSVGSKENYSISTVAVLDSTNPLCTAPFDQGNTFISLASKTSGSTTSICATDFSDGLLELASTIAESATSLLLDQVPDESTITVTFNDVTSVPLNSSNGYTFDSSSNRIIFHGSFVPSDGTSIAVKYIPQDIIR